MKIIIVLVISILLAVLCWNLSSNKSNSHVSIELRDVKRMQIARSQFPPAKQNSAAISETPRYKDVSNEDWAKVIDSINDFERIRTNAMDSGAVLASAPIASLIINGKEYKLYKTLGEEFDKKYLR